MNSRLPFLLVAIVALAKLMLVASIVAHAQPAEVPFELRTNIIARTSVGSFSNVVAVAPCTRECTLITWVDRPRNRTNEFHAWLVPVLLETNITINPKTRP